LIESHILVAPRTENPAEAGLSTQVAAKTPLPEWIGRPIGRRSQVDQWNCSSSVEPVRAFTEDEPPWITVVTSSK
jgi:hypothetical protein